MSSVLSVLCPISISPARFQGFFSPWSPRSYTLRIASRLMHNVGATQWRDRDKYTHETSAPNFHLNLACLCQFDDDHDHDHSVIYQPCPKSCQAGVYMITPISRLISDKAERLNPSTALKQVRAWAMPDSTLSLITKACDQRFFFPWCVHALYCVTPQRSMHFGPRTKKP